MSELHDVVTALYRKAGCPSLREIARRAGGTVSHATVSDAVQGRRTPSWRVLEAVVIALDGVPAAVRPAWEDEALRANKVKRTPTHTDIMKELQVIRRMLERLLDE